MIGSLAKPMTFAGNLATANPVCSQAHDDLTFTYYRREHRHFPDLFLHAATKMNLMTT